MENYATPGAAVSHKAFQNLPMNTEAPPVIVPPAGAKHGSKIRNLETGVGYTDRFVTHPIPGNYVAIVEHLDALREANKRELEDQRDNYPTLLSLAEHNYTNIGRSADEQAQNSIRDRLRQSGASDEEIEIIMRESRIKKLKEMSEKAETQEQAMMRHLLQRTVGSGMRQEPGGKQEKPIPSGDQNVFNFPTRPPLLAHESNAVALPGNEIFAGRRTQGINPPGAPLAIPVVGGQAKRRLMPVMNLPPELRAPQRTSGNVTINVPGGVPIPSKTELQKKIERGEKIVIPQAAVEEVLKPLKALAKQKPHLAGEPPAIVVQSPYEAQYRAASNKGQKQKITKLAKLMAEID
jgi:hypothetical protein